MRVGIDLDGVCYDFGAAYRHWLEITCQRNAAEMGPATHWYFYRDWGLTDEQFVGTFAAGVNAGVIFAHGQPMPGTDEAFSRIKAGGHSIHIATDRSIGLPGMAASLTLEWLARYELPYDSITFGADKTLLDVDIFIDDKLENYDALDAKGRRVFLRHQPWNLAPGKRRVADLNHFAQIVERVA